MKFINFIFKIFRKKVKVSFKRPNNNNLIVFDGMSYQDLTFVLEDFEYFVIENR